MTVFVKCVLLFFHKRSAMHCVHDYKHVEYYAGKKKKYIYIINK